MKKSNKKDLRSEIVALITCYFNKGDYSIELKKYAYGADNYCDGAVTIGGMRFGCSFHKQGYICWFDMGDMMRGVVGLNRKLWEEVDKLIAEHQEETKEQRIEELEKELKELKGE
jgi:hypothetical protein